MKFGVDVYFRQELKSLSGGWFAGQQERTRRRKAAPGQSICLEPIIGVMRGMDARSAGRRGP